jgi:ATP-dependent RNA circularization protein (DNA/RNA ligase family)
MNKYKYPRTFHLPWSPGFTNDDKVLDNTEHFHGKHVVVTEKLDGENTTMYSNYLHARSTEYSYHPSREWVKNLHGKIKHEIPETYRICGENVYAKHSIHYKNLSTYFYVFSIWEEDKCLSWKDTLEWCSLLGLESVPILYDGIYNEKLIKSLQINFDDMEGYVVRNVNNFNILDFSKNIAKFVRKNHITTDEHWRTKPVIPNLLKVE